MSESWIRVCPTCYSDELQILSIDNNLPDRCYCSNCRQTWLREELEYGATKE